MTRRTPKAQRDAFVEEYEQSGMSQQAYAKTKGIHPTTFSGWVRQHRNGLNVQATKRTATSFIEVAPVVEPDVTQDNEWQCQVAAGSAVIHFREPPPISWLVSLIEAVRA